MLVTIVHRGRATTHEVGWQLALGGDPQSDVGIVPDGRGPWTAVLRASDAGWRLVTIGLPCTLNGAPVAGETALAAGDVIEIGAARVVFGYREAPLPAVPPLDAVEQALLSRIGVAATDEHTRRVLGDHWLMGADEPRGALVQQQCEGHDGAALLAEHGPRWRRTTVAAGFDPAQLELRRGFASAALVLQRGESLVACPDALRLSPRQYLLGRELAVSPSRRHFEVVARTLAGEHDRYVLKCAQPERPLAPIEHDAAVLAKLDHPNLVELFDLALHRDLGLGVVMPWAGIPLATRLRRGLPDEALAIALGLPLCDALAALAAKAIVHKELEPSTVLLREDGHVTLAGFGSATGPDLPTSSPTRGFGLTRHRFRHMSHEQVRGLPLSPATDLFSLAIVLATIALGRHPLPLFDSDFDTLVAIRDHRFDLPTTTPLLQLLATAIVPDAAARPTAAALGAALAALGPRDPERIAQLVSSGAR